MYKKGQWVRHLERNQIMRVLRDQLPEEKHAVWCECNNGGYHLECHDVSEVVPAGEGERPAGEGGLDPAA